jgi:hypothetical protein
MCSLPNFQARDLEVHFQYRKKQKKKTEAETMELITSICQLLEKPI